MECNGTHLPPKISVFQNIASSSGQEHWSHRPDLYTTLLILKFGGVFFYFRFPWEIFCHGLQIRQNFENENNFSDFCALSYIFQANQFSIENISTLKTRMEIGSIRPIFLTRYRCSTVRNSKQ